MNTQTGLQRILLGLAAATAAASPARGTELILRNDAMTTASSVTPCICFIAGDVPAAWLTAPFAGKIVGVQVFWKSQLGGAPTTQETAIRIYDGSTFPTPGAVLGNDGGGDAEITTPLLSDGVLNEFRYLDPGHTTPLSVTVSAGQTVAVGLEIFNPSSGGGSFTPSLTYDAGGCQTGKNGVYVFDAATWFDACTQGLTGDWVVRAILDTDADIPAVSHWGLAVLALTTLTAGTILARRRRAAPPHTGLYGDPQSERV